MTNKFMHRLNFTYPKFAFENIANIPQKLASLFHYVTSLVLHLVYMVFKFINMIPFSDNQTQPTTLSKVSLQNK